MIESWLHFLSQLLSSEIRTRKMAPILYELLCYRFRCSIWMTWMRSCHLMH